MFTIFHVSLDIILLPKFTEVLFNISEVTEVFLLYFNLNNLSELHFILNQNLNMFI